MTHQPVGADEATGASLALRSYENSDLQDIRRLLDGLASPTGREYDAEEMIRQHGKDLIYVAELQGRVVGFAIGIFNDWNGTAYLDFILVGRDHLRKGIGTALMEAVVKGVKDRGARLIHTETGKTNTGALCFYLQKGFVPTGVIPDYYREGEDAIVLVREL